MKPDFWHEIWSKGHIGFHQHDFNKHMQRFVSALNVRPGAHIFVPLCGKSRDMIWLAEQGYRVTGVEISSSAVEAFFEENKLNYQVTRAGKYTLYSNGSIRIYCANFFDIELSDIPDIDAVYDRASLIALPPEMRAAYVDHLTGFLRPGTRSLLVTLDYQEHQMSGPPFAVTQFDVKDLYGKRYDIEAIHSEDCLANEPRFIKKGLTRLDEHVFVLEKKPAIN